MNPFVSAAVALAAAVLAGASIPLLLPLLRRYAMARPNARSSHRVPTPQGAGLCVVFAIAVCVAAAAGPNSSMAELIALGVAMVLLTVAGALDDLLEIGVVPRLLAQGVAVAVLVGTTFHVAGDATLFPFLPRFVEWTIAILLGVWFVNLTNFMDGIDGITAVNGIILAVAVALTPLVGVDALSGLPQTVAAALVGSLAGFLIWNRPRARVFLGDVGSLPVGLLSAWLLFKLALAGHLAAAIALPLYPVADATVTVLRRLLRGEKIWVAHRSHAYQQAVDRGVPVVHVLVAIGAADLLLAAGALAMTIIGGTAMVWVILALALLVATLVLRFLEGRLI